MRGLWPPQIQGQKGRPCPVPYATSCECQHRTFARNNSLSPGQTRTQPVNHALDSILEMAVQMPALKKIGDQIGLSMDDGLLDARRDKTEGGDTQG